MIRDLNRNFILDLDWLKQNNVRIYFDLKCLRVNGKHYVNLEEDIHIASTVRMKKDMLKEKLGKSCSFGLPRVPFVNCCQFMYVVISLFIPRAGCGI